MMGDEGRQSFGGAGGRYPPQAVGWYRKKLEIPATDSGKSIFLAVDGAMSYSTVWLTGRLVGGGTVMSRGAWGT